MHRVLLDPLLLIPPAADVPNQDYATFWERLLDWASDGRVGIGRSCHTYVFDHYAIYGYPRTELKNIDGRHVRREYHRALTQLLSRVLDHRSEAGHRTMEPEYLGTSEESECLEFDASGTVGHNVVGLATLTEYWTVESPHIRFDPAPPESLHVCLESNVELAEERDGARHAFFKKRRIFIIGGQVDAGVLDAIAYATGLGPDRLSWIPSEKSKPARNVDQRWSGLRKADIAICITGRIGHAQSDVARDTATSRGANYLPIERPGDIVRILEALAVHGSI